MEKDFIVFWREWRKSNGSHGGQSVVRVKHPPHDAPRGSMLRSIISDGLLEAGLLVEVTGAVELPPANWNNNLVLEVASFDGAITSVECTGGAWRVVA